MDKKTVAVVFGGCSSEHEISCISAATIIKNLDSTRYKAVLIGITKEGRWLWVDSLEQLEQDTWRESGTAAILSPDAGRKGILIEQGGSYTFVPVDVVFPALHGLYGEDGTIQGLLELAQLPYVGCGVLASAVSMDKWYTKIIVDTLGIRQACYVPVPAGALTDMEAVAAQVEESLSYPVFVKPSNAGSSCGVSKAQNREELAEALLLAAEYDRKLLVEETIVGRELECAILGGAAPEASGVGEILAAAEFYDYEAKYHNEDSRTVISPELPAGIEAEIRRDAVRIFQAVDGFGLARVDFFLEAKTGEVVFNELNTLPGFTNISMYQALWAAEGLEKPALISRLIELALTRGRH